MVVMRIVDRDDQLELRPEVLEQELLPTAVAAQHVAAGLPEHARLDVPVGLGEVLAPPALRDRLLDVLAVGALHRGAVVLGVVPALLVAVLEVPEEGRRDGSPHLPDLAHHLEHAVLGHLLGHGRVRLRHQAAHGDHAGDGLLGGLLARGRLGPQHHLAVHAHDGPGARAGSLLAPVAGEAQQQRHGALHQVAVVVLARVPADEDLGLARGHLAGQVADVVRVDLADLAGALRRVVLQVTAQPREDGLHLDHAEVLEHHPVAALEGRIDARQRQRVAGGGRHACPRTRPTRRTGPRARPRRPRCRAGSGRCPCGRAAGGRSAPARTACRRAPRR